MIAPPARTRSERKGALAVLAVLVGLAAGAVGTARPDTGEIAVGPQSIPALRIDLNSASESELGLLPGVGPDRARRLVVHRDVYGPFRSLDDVAAVKGIGPGAADRLRGLAVTREVPRE